MNKIKRNNFIKGESSFILIYILAGLVGLVVLTYYLMNTKAVPSFGEYMAQNSSDIASSTDTASTTADTDGSFFSISDGTSSTTVGALNDTSSTTTFKNILSNSVNSSSTNIKSITVNSITASSSSAKDLHSGKIVISAPKGNIYVTVATTTTDQEKGLGGRLSMPVDEGMIFAFADAASRGFWMQDMSISLDMIWIRKDKTIAGITHNISPDTYPEIFLPPEPVMYVLELNAGTSEKYGMATGTPLTFVL